MEIRNNNIHFVQNNNVQKKDKTNPSQSQDTKDISNCPNPSEYIGRSQVVFRGKEGVVEPAKKYLPKYSKEDLKPIELKESPILSKEDMLKTLDELGYTQEEIEQIDFNDEKIVKGLSGLKTYLDIDEFKEIKEEVLSSFKERSSEEKLEFIQGELSSECFSYANQENFDALRKYMNFDLGDFLSVCDDIIDTDYKDDILKNLPLAYCVQGELDKDVIRDLRYLDSSDNISYERADILRQINERLPENRNLPLAQCGNLGTDEDLTDEKVNEYLNILERYGQKEEFNLESLLPTYERKDLKTITEDVAQVENILEKYPIDFSLTEDASKITIKDLQNITQREDIGEIQKYLNSLTPEAKSFAIFNLPNQGSKIDKTKLAQIYNTVCEKDYGKVNCYSLNEFLNTQEENDYKDLDGIIKVINKYKGTDTLDTNYMERVFTFGGNDYDSAITALDLRDELKQNNVNINISEFNSILHNPESDLKEFSKILTYIRDNKIDSSKYPPFFLSDPKGYNKIALIHHIGKNIGDYDYDRKSKLYKLGEMLNNDEELNYAIDLLKQKPSPDSEDYEKRFDYYSFEDVKEIMQSYQQDKEATKAIVDMKDKNDNWRIPAKKDILPTIEAYQLDKDTTIDILNLTNQNGRERFYHGKTIKSLVETAQIDKDYTFEIINKKNTIGNIKRVPYRFSEDNDIKNVVTAGQLDKDFTNYLLDLTYKDDYDSERYRIYDSEDYIFFAQKASEGDKDFITSLFELKENRYGKEEFRLNTETIKSILENPKENREFLLDFINEKDEYGMKYSTYDIQEVAEATNIDKELTEKLLKTTFTVTRYDDKKEEYKRFNRVSDVTSIVKNSVIDPEFTKELLDKTLENYNGDLVPRFNSDDINSLLYLRKTESKEDIDKFLNETVVTYDNKIVPRFNTGDICTIFNLYKKDKPLTDELLNETYNYNGRDCHLYSVNDIYYILEACDSNKDYVNKLLKHNRTINNNNNLLLSGGDIYTLTESSTINEALTDKLLNYRKIDEGKETLRFNIEEINALVRLSEDQDGQIENLVDIKDSEKNHLSFKTIRKLNSNLNKNPEMTNIVLNKKDIDGNLLLKEKSLDKFLTALRFCDEVPSDLINSDEYQNAILKMTDDDTYSSYDISLYTNFQDFINKSETYELSKTEKKDLLMKLLIHKSSLTEGNKLNNKLIPNGDKEYAGLVKQLTQNLNLNIEPLNEEKKNEFYSGLNELTESLKSMDLSNLKKIELTMSHEEFNSKVLDIMKGLNKKEQAKIQDYFGFKITDNKLTGYPTEKNDDLSKYDIIEPKTVEALNKVQSVVQEYANNNFITTADNPELNNLLKTITKHMPELYNQIDNSDVFVDTIKSLQKIVQNPKFEKLSDDDKNVILISTLLHNTDKVSDSTSESAFDAYFISKKLGVTDEQAQKIYKVVESSDLINKFMSTTKKDTVVNTRSNHIRGQARENIFDLLTFNLKEDNIFELSQMLYTTKEKEGLTRHLDKMIEQRIFEMKSNDFMLPQTAQERYQELSTVQEINGHNVSVVKAEDVPDMHAYIHTPEAGYATGGTRDANLANFEIFKDFADNKVICTSYVTPDKAALVKEFRHGFIFDVKNDKQYVAYNRDIFSLAKNIPNMLIEYYRNKGFVANRGKGEKFTHRTNVSDKLKEAMGISDKEYVEKMDSLKAKLGKETLTLEKVKMLDPQLYDAYQKLFESENLLNAHNHNEALVSNPQISAIFTNDIENLPEEYLVMAEEQNLPIVVFNTNKKENN